MQLLKKTGKSLFIGTVVGIAIAIATSFFIAELINRIEDQTYYMRYKWEFDDTPGLQKPAQEKNEAEEAVNGIYIVDIDDRSQHKLGNYWNWDRSFHADMIRNLNSHFPAAIVFDILFYDPEDSGYIKKVDKLISRSKTNNPGMSFSPSLRKKIMSSIDYDKQFINATQEAGNVFHSLCMTEKKDYPDYALSQIEPKTTLAWHDSLHPSSAILLPPEKRKLLFDSKPVLDGTFTGLAQAAQEIGFVNIPKNKDGVIREIPLLYSFGDNAPVYLPLSVRTVATLFGTPNNEIIFEPQKYLEIGKPFKILKDSANTLHCSYPNVTKELVRAIIDNSDKIKNLPIDKRIDIASYCKIGKNDKNAPYVEMYCGTFTEEIIKLLPQNIKPCLSMLLEKTITLAPNISVKRNSDNEWTLSAPFGDEEWSLSLADMQTWSYISPDAFKNLSSNQSRLLFYSFTVSNKNNRLVSSIPVLRDSTLLELCGTNWSTIERIPPGKRMDFGQTVRIPLTKYNRHIVTYFGKKSKPFPYYSYYDILKDRIQGSLDGKIFIVGSTVPSMFDIVSAPVDNTYPGVEVHASLINSFLTNTFITRLSPWQDFFLLLCIGIIIGFLSFMFKPVAGGILVVFSIFAYLLFAMGIFGSSHIWIEIVRPIITIILTFTTIMAFRYITEEKDRKFLQKTFKHYLSPELIDIMYNKKQTPMLGGDEGIRTAFFTDIQGFSTFSEKIGSPTRLVELLNEYLSEMTDSLLSHFGTLDKYEGDAIIAFFGAPMPIDDHATQACLAALDMQEKLTRLRKKWKSEGAKWPAIVHDMHMRIGINTGNITTGNMGSKVRMNYTMMGDAVNLAARLESAAKQYGIYTMISQYTRELIKNDFETRQIDKITVVGKSEPVIVYELLGKNNNLTSEIINLLEQYNKGIACYYEQKWDKAIAIFEKCHALEPNKIIAKGKSPSMIFLERSKKYLINHPGNDWNGVYNLESK